MQCEYSSMQQSMRGSVHLWSAFHPPSPHHPHWGLVTMSQSLHHHHIQPTNHVNLFLSFLSYGKPPACGASLTGSLHTWYVNITKLSMMTFWIPNQAGGKRKYPTRSLVWEVQKRYTDEDMKSAWTIRIYYNDYYAISILQALYVLILTLHGPYYWLCLVISIWLWTVS